MLSMCIEWEDGFKRVGNLNKEVTEWKKGLKAARIRNFKETVKVSLSKWNMFSDYKLKNKKYFNIF